MESGSESEVDFNFSSSEDDNFNPFLCQSDCDYSVDSDSDELIEIIEVDPEEFRLKSTPSRMRLDFISLPQAMKSFRQIGGMVNEDNKITASFLWRIAKGVIGKTYDSSDAQSAIHLMETLSYFGGGSELPYELIETQRGLKILRNCNLILIGRTLDGHKVIKLHNSVVMLSSICEGTLMHTGEQESLACCHPILQEFYQNYYYMVKWYKAKGNCFANWWEKVLDHVKLVREYQEFANRYFQKYFQFIKESTVQKSLIVYKKMYTEMNPSTFVIRCQQMDNILYVPDDSSSAKVMLMLWKNSFDAFKKIEWHVSIEVFHKNVKLLFEIGVKEDGIYRNQILNESLRAEKLLLRYFKERDNHFRDLANSVNCLLGIFKCLDKMGQHGEIVEVLEYMRGIWLNHIEKFPYRPEVNSWITVYKDAFEFMDHLPSAKPEDSGILILEELCVNLQEVFDFILTIKGKRELYDCNNFPILMEYYTRSLERLNRFDQMMTLVAQADPFWIEILEFQVERDQQLRSSWKKFDFINYVNGYFDFQRRMLKIVTTLGDPNRKEPFLRQSLQSSKTMVALSSIIERNYGQFEDCHNGGPSYVIQCHFTLKLFDELIEYSSDYEKTLTEVFEKNPTSFANAWIDFAENIINYLKYPYNITGTSVNRLVHQLDAQTRRCSNLAIRSLWHEHTKLVIEDKRRNIGLFIREFLENSQCPLNL